MQHVKEIEVSLQKRLIIQDRLKELLDKSFFSICTVTELMQLTGTDGTNRDTEAYNLLRALHCVDFDKMGSNTKDMIPDLLYKVLFTVEVKYKNAVTDMSYKERSDVLMYSIDNL